MASCDDDFLNRYPLAEISPENSFQTANDLEKFTNSFYNDIPSANTIVKGDNISDNILYNGIPDEQSGLRIVSGEAGSGGFSWADLRKINTFFKYYEQCSDADAREYYSGLAHFFRAYFYFEKVKRFGDVPYYTEVIGTGDEDLLMKARDSRVLVIDNIISDLDLAIEFLGTEKASDVITRWTALALKSRVCLFEGTYRKYHSDLNLPDSDILLSQCYTAAERLMKESPYTIYYTGNNTADYRDLFASKDIIENEVILARRYSQTFDVMHSINYYLISPTQEDISLTKAIINEYLNSNGTSFTSLLDYDKKTFSEETIGRDPRLAQTIRTPGYSRIGSTTKLVPDFDAAISGYQLIKFLGDESMDGNAASYQDIPIIRYAEVLLNFAEAKAELGILTQADIDASVKLLRTRVNMPNMNIASANADPDTYLAGEYPNVTGANQGAILEIRRERRIELVCEGFRYDDLMRWKCGKLLENHFSGMYFPALGEYDLDADGINDVVLYTNTTTSKAPQQIQVGDFYTLTDGSSGNLIPFTDRTKEFDEAIDYLYPIPSGDILLNPNLEQNPGWKTR